MSAHISKKEHVDLLEIPALRVFISYFVNFMVSAVILGALMLVWGEHVLVEISSLAGFQWSGLPHVWFIFAWALVISLALPAKSYYASKQTLAGRAVWLSLNAGFWEELIYRGIAFLGAMITLPFLNFITFGLVKWLYGHIFVPFSNMLTLGALETHLVTDNWVLGAAVVSAAASFRKAHEHLGLLGYINSWFMGMVLFWLMFNYGIVTAMVAHFLYDLIVFMVGALKSHDETRELMYRLGL